MKIFIEKRFIVATTEDDKEVLRVLFNARELRDAYIFWSDAKPLYSEYDWLKEYNPTAFIVLNNNADLEAPGSGAERAKVKIEKEIAEIDEQKQENIDNIFGFLNEDKN